MQYLRGWAARGPHTRVLHSHCGAVLSKLFLCPLNSKAKVQTDESSTSVPTPRPKSACRVPSSAPRNPITAWPFTPAADMCPNKRRGEFYTAVFNTCCSRGPIAVSYVLPGDRSHTQILLLSHYCNYTLAYCSTAFTCEPHVIFKFCRCYSLTGLLSLWVLFRWNKNRLKCLCILMFSVCTY